MAFPRSERTSRLVLAGLLTLVGTLHFANPKPFDDLIPEFLGRPRPWTYGSGLAELCGAALLARQKTAKLGGWYVAALFLAVFPGNVKAAVTQSPPPWDNPVLGYGRLPLQIPLILWALRHARADVAG